MEPPSYLPPALPSSPSTVQLPSCIEELVRFTLASALDGTLGADLGLSRDYCARLLQAEGSLEDPRLAYLKPPQAGLKTVEGRCALGNYTQICPGALLVFNKCLLLQVQHVKRYTSFLEMLEAETLDNVLPGVKTTQEGVKIYRNFYTEEKERSNGVLAIYVSRPDFQPHASMSALLSGLGYEGISCLLGMVRTNGTILEELPPSRSVLLSSFMVPNRPDVVL